MTTPAAPPRSDGRLVAELDHVHKSYQEGGRQRQVLAGADLELRQGERVALLGRSGSGKSTLLNLIAGLDQADAGRVLVDTIDLTRASDQQRTLLRRRRVGFIYQSFNLIPTLTVAENIALPLELNAWQSADARQRTTQLLAEVGLAERAASYPHQLSGGEQQRVAICRALSIRPPIVLADEPTGNLDSTTGRHVLEMLATLSVEQEATLLLVTHSREVARSADRLLMLQDGRIVADQGEVAW
jgi:putative ABC transport system ATP-binding protein